MPKGQPISDPINSGDRDEDERRGQSIEQRMSKNNSSKSLKSMLTPKKQGPKEDSVQEQVGRMEISKVKYKLIAGLCRGLSHPLSSCCMPPSPIPLPLPLPRPGSIGSPRPPRPSQPRHALCLAQGDISFSSSRLSGTAFAASCCGEMQREI